VSRTAAAVRSLAVLAAFFSASGQFSRRSLGP
jgi:hypothetical protein